MPVVSPNHQQLCSISGMKTTIYLVRHGEVYNPEGIIYGRLPGYGLSERGRVQVEAAAAALADLAPCDVLFSSPLQRAQESAALISARLSVPVQIDDRLAETDIGGYQGRPFADLPSPYVTETGVTGIESAVSMRTRLMAWAQEATAAYRRIIAVSHRDPIAIALLAWQDLGLEPLATMSLPTATVQEITLEAEQVDVVCRWPVEAEATD